MNKIDTQIRIKNIEITNFRVFPGPLATNFELNSNNLLVYGENGSGKSSLYYAIKEFFTNSPFKSISDTENVFSNKLNLESKIKVEFNNNLTVEWSNNNHPLKNLNVSNQLISEIALRIACLDYRALLETNFKQGNGTLNFFNIAVEQLLRDYVVVLSGGITTTIGQLWENVKEAKPINHTIANLKKINHACTTFNTAFRTVLPDLVQLINELMIMFGCGEVKLKGFNTPGLTYNKDRIKQNRTIDGKVLTPEISFREHNLMTPQLFLNEARLTSFALAMYFAGRLISTPTANKNALKLLVLDDVLIGLDHSNRIPILEVLNQKFSDWQIILLTHDRNWFDIARSYFTSSDWNIIEIFEGNRLSPVPTPIVYSGLKHHPRAILQKAIDLLNTVYIEASANYARQAFELGLHIACEIHNIEMPYRRQGAASKKLYTLQYLFDKLKKFILNSQRRNIQLIANLNKLEHFKNFILNPYSHPNAPNIPKNDVLESIKLIEEFLELTSLRRD